MTHLQCLGPVADPATMYREHHPQALRVAAAVFRRYGLSVALAEDAVQDGLLKYARQLDRLEPGRPPRAYFLAVVRNAAVDLARREARERRARDVLQFARPATAAAPPAAEPAA